MNRRSTCRQCGRVDNEVGQISRSGLCRYCAAENTRFAAESLVNKSGPVYLKWARNTAAGYARHRDKQLALIDQQARAAEQAHQAIAPARSGTAAAR